MFWQVQFLGESFCQLGEKTLERDRHVELCQQCWSRFLLLALQKFNVRMSINQDDDAPQMQTMRSNMLPIKAMDNRQRSIHLFGLALPDPDFACPQAYK